MPYLAQFQGDAIYVFFVHGGQPPGESNAVLAQALLMDSPPEAAPLPSTTSQVPT